MSMNKGPLTPNERPKADRLQYHQRQTCQDPPRRMNRCPIAPLHRNRADNPQPNPGVQRIAVPVP